MNPDELTATDDRYEDDDPADRLIGVFPQMTEWGNRITLRDGMERCDGHMTPRVERGDRFGYQMESGRIGVFVLVDVDHCLDPPDMFFADIEPVGYCYTPGCDCDAEDHAVWWDDPAHAALYFRVVCSACDAERRWEWRERYSPFSRLGR